MARKVFDAWNDHDTLVARIVLQAVLDVETIRGAEGRPVGRRQLANFLRGNQLPAQPVEAGWLAGSTFGIFWNHGPRWLAAVTDCLLEEGYLEAHEAPERVRMTRSGRRLLRGRERPRGRLLPRPPRLGEHPGVEAALRTLRRRLAEKAGRPPYGIFSNATLAHLAAARPRNLAELSAVPGLGAERLRRFGARILDTLRQASR